MASSFRDFTIWQYFASIIKLVKLLAQCEELPLTGIFQRLFKENFVSDFQALIQVSAISLPGSFALSISKMCGKQSRKRDYFASLAMTVFSYAGCGFVIARPSVPWQSQDLLKPCTKAEVASLRSAMTFFGRL